MRYHDRFQTASSEQSHSDVSKINLSQSFEVNPTRQTVKCHQIISWDIRTTLRN